MGVVLLAGLCFLLGGFAVVIPAAVTGQVRADGELPTDAPHWLRVLQYLLGMIILASLAMVGTWVAFGAGDRSFSISAPFVTSSGGPEILGRTAFGIGAAVSWLCLIAVGISGWRRLNRCRRLAKDRENLNRNAIVFLKLASIRLMLRKFCNPC